MTAANVNPAEIRTPEQEADYTEQLLRLADTPNRTYPGNRYSIEQLKPVHLQRVEGEAPSGTPGDAEAAVAPAGRCPFA